MGPSPPALAAGGGALYSPALGARGAWAGGGLRPSWGREALARVSKALAHAGCVEPLLVMGASGLLGQHAIAAARGRPLAATYASNPTRTMTADSRVLDLADGVAVHRVITDVSPWAIILAAALTSVDYCEDHPMEAEAINAQGPGLVAEAAREVGARLLHVSTDYVFDGEKGWYGEDATPAPRSVYGKTKLQGEQRVLAALSGACIVRACAVYGWNRLTAKTNFATWILGELEAGRDVKLWADQFITPTYAGDAAPILLHLLERGARGTYHVASSNCMNRWEFGRVLADVFSLPRSRVKASSMVEAQLKAPRPQNSCLDVRRVEKELNIHLPPAGESLKAMRASR